MAISRLRSTFIAGGTMKKKGCLVAFLLAVVIATFFAFSIKRALTPRDLSMEDPAQAFASFVCSPLPRSVHVFKASGVVSMAGGHAHIDFELDPRDHDDLIHRGRFRLADNKSRKWIMEFQPEGVSDEITRYVRLNEGMAETALFVSQDRRKAWFREIQY